MILTVSILVVSCGIGNSNTEPEKARVTIEILEGKRVIFDIQLKKGYTLVQVIQAVVEGEMTDTYTTNIKGEMIWTVWK